MAFTTESVSRVLSQFSEREYGYLLIGGTLYLKFKLLQLHQIWHPKITL